MNPLQSQKLIESNVASYHVMILGDHFVGRTSLVNRFFRDEFEEITPMHVGLNFEKKIVSFGGKKHSINFWDVNGLDSLKSNRLDVYRIAQAALLCYDVSRLESFRGLKMAMTELRKHNEYCLIYLCATKRDLLDNTELEQALSLVIDDKNCDLTRYKLFVTSSKTGENVHGMFMEIIRDVFNSQPGLVQIEDATENVSNSFCRIS